MYLNCDCNNSYKKIKIKKNIIGFSKSSINLIEIMTLGIFNFEVLLTKSLLDN